MTFPSVSKTVRISFDLWERIQNSVVDGTFPDFSHGIRELAEGGYWLLKNKDKLQDKEIVKQFLDDWNSKMNEKNIFDWVKQLPDSQVEAVRVALEMERERRI